LPGCQPQAKIKDVGNDQPIEGRGEKFFILISPFSKGRHRGIYLFAFLSCIKSPLSPPLKKGELKKELKKKQGDLSPSLPNDKE